MQELGSHLAATWQPAKQKAELKCSIAQCGPAIVASDTCKDLEGCMVMKPLQAAVLAVIQWPVAMT